MNRFRFTLAQLMAIVLFIGFGFAALRNANALWASATFSLAQTQQSRHQPQSSGLDFAEVAKGEKKPAKSTDRAGNRTGIPRDFVSSDQEAKSPNGV